MAKNEAVRIGPLRERELGEAARIVRLAFGTFLGLPDPMQFMEGRDLMTPRWRARNTRVLAAHIDGRLVGSNVITRWGSFGFFGPLTVLPEFWDHGVAQRLIGKYREGSRRLETTAQRSVHFRAQRQARGPLQQIRLLARIPDGTDAVRAGDRHRAAEGSAPALLSALKKSQREEAIRACARLTNRIEKGLDLSDEIRAALGQGVGDVAMIHSCSKIDGFAVCMAGPGSEGGKTCYVKFGMVRGDDGPMPVSIDFFDAIDGFAVSRGTDGKPVGTWRAETRTLGCAPTATKPRHRASPCNGRTGTDSTGPTSTRWMTGGKRMQANRHCRKHCRLFRD